MLLVNLSHFINLNIYVSNEVSKGIILIWLSNLDPCVLRIEG